MKELLFVNMMLTWYNILTSFRGAFLLFTDNIHYFVVTCQSRSIAGAAEKLYISRQALSLTLKRFEEELGVQLFVRSRHGILLTPAGEVFYARCSKLDNELTAAINEVRLLGQKSKTVIKTAFSLIALRILTVPRICQFEESNSDVLLEFRSMPSIEAWELLADSQLDFVCSIHPPKDYGFQSLLIQSSSASLLVPSSSPLANAGIITPELLRGCTLLNAQGIMQFDSDQQIQDLNIDFRPFTNDPNSISDAVAQGIGYYAVASNALNVFNTDGITIVPVRDGIMNFGLYITFRNDRALNKTDKRFISHIKSIAK